MQRMIEFDNTQACSEGWAIFNDCELQRLDDAGVFESDSAAVQFVLSRASAGSDYHRQAIALTSPHWLHKTIP